MVFEKPTETTLRVLQPLLAFWSVLRFDWPIRRLGIVVLQLYQDFTTLSNYFKRVTKTIEFHENPRILQEN